MSKTVIELCAASFVDCTYADKYNLDRIELNSALELGGLTPSFSLVRQVKEHIKTPVYTMIRPRGAGFNYSGSEFEIMYEDAIVFLELGVEGIVFGFLDSSNHVDIGRTKTFVDLAHGYGAQAVFHKALDSAADYKQALSDLASCGVDRVLTSGAGVYPNMDYEMLKYAIEEYNGIMEILPGGGVRVDNVKEILRETKTSQIHMTSKKQHFDPIDKENSFYIGTDEEQLIELLKLIEE